MNVDWQFSGAYRLLLIATGLMAATLFAVWAGGKITAAEASKRPPLTLTGWKSEVLACSVVHKRTRYTFKLRLSGWANNMMVNANRLRYKITPSSARSRKNNLNIGPALRSVDRRPLLQEKRLVAGSRWQSKRIKLRIRRGDLHKFEAIFDLRRAADPRCEGTLVL